MNFHLRIKNRLQMPIYQLLAFKNSRIRDVYSPKSDQKYQGPPIVVRCCVFAMFNCLVSIVNFFKIEGMYYPVGRTSATTYVCGIKIGWIFLRIEVIYVFTYLVKLLCTVNQLFLSFSR